MKGIVTIELAGQPKERLFQVVVSFSGDLKVLKIVLAMKCHVIHFPVSDVGIVATQDNGDTGTDTGQIVIPVGHTLVCDAGSEIKHDNGTLRLDIESIFEAPKFLWKGKETELY